MKRIFSMAMLMLLLFNIGGHVLLSQYLDQRGNSLSNSFKSEETRNSKHTPSVNEEKGFDEDTGQMEVIGRNYNDVAIKLTLDTVYLKYTSHYEEPRLVDELSLKEMGDNPLQKKNHQLEKKSSIDNEYNFTILFLNTDVNGSTLLRSFAYITPQLTNTYLSTPGQPPELS